MPQIMGSHYIGERIRINCDRCNEYMYTTIIDDANNTKNDKCRKCKHEIKCIQYHTEGEQ